MSLCLFGVCFHFAVCASVVLAVASMLLNVLVCFCLRFHVVATITTTLLLLLLCLLSTRGCGLVLGEGGNIKLEFEIFESHRVESHTES